MHLFCNMPLICVNIQNNYSDMQLNMPNNHINMRQTMLQVNIIMLNVGINKLHFNKIMLHVDKIHLAFSKIHLACRGQKYANIQRSSPLTIIVQILNRAKSNTLKQNSLPSPQALNNKLLFNVLSSNFQRKLTPLFFLLQVSSSV